MSENTVASSLFWKMLERFGVQGSSFVLSIILARILTPDLYGILALMLIFTSIANVFVQSGLNTALIREKKVEDGDYSSVFWLSFTVATCLYIILFLAAPLIEKFYDVEGLATPFRILALILLPGAFNSVQVAKISRNLEFKSLFKSHLLSVLLSGSLGIYLAYNGAGLWSLVAKECANSFFNCIFLFWYVRWLPSIELNLVRLKKLFSFGWKILVTVLIDNVYNDFRSLVIGRKYDAATLGFYERGRQFPMFLINGINGAVQSVMLPAFAKKQDDKQSAFSLMRKSITLTSYLLFPLMAILAASGESVIRLLLSDKWLPSLPYMQIYCLMLCIWPLHTCNCQMINAMGRSDIFLKIEILKKSIGLLGLTIALIVFDSPLAIAVSAAITGYIDFFINAYPNKKLVGYSVFKQIKDIYNPFLISIALFFFLKFFDNFILNDVLMILLKVSLGISLYSILMLIFRPSSLFELVKILKRR
ncbi:MAG: lipopolysaccharide biosynthesis protein [Clostridia bacterium]|nr:lipopolysaccharide biosynthesis protein [Clostridia bacterium]